MCVENFLSFDTFKDVEVENWKIFVGEWVADDFKKHVIEVPDRYVCICFEKDFLNFCHEFKEIIPLIPD